jgi:hypothetical protein
MYSQGQKVRCRITKRIGEILHVYGQGMYRVRYPVYGDEDRDFDIQDRRYTEVEPTGWIQCDHSHSRQVYFVPC